MSLEDTDSSVVELVKDSERLLISEPADKKSDNVGTEYDFDR